MLSSGFVLHPQLEQDTVWVGELPLSQVRLHTNAAWPWLILVPRVPGSPQELADLTVANGQTVYKEILKMSILLRHLFQPAKLNVGVLGNIVSQLHIHLVARYTDDPAWPGPVWGHSASKAYTADALQERIGTLAERLKMDQTDL